MSAQSVDALFLPFAAGKLSWPGRALFLRARFGAPLLAYPDVDCEQTFKPDAQALERAGCRVIEAPVDRYPLVLMLPPRQREESRAMMARAFQHLEPGGRILACAANNEGARSRADDLERLAGALEVLTKHKHRVFWTAPLERPTDPQLSETWTALDALKPIADGRFFSRPGLFAWDRIDDASALLAQHLPLDLAGHAADLGAGFGFLSVQLLERCPRITALDLYEAERRALEAAQRTKIEYLWCDVAAGLKRRYDLIVTNPPFHAQQALERPDLGRRFIQSAAQALHPGGQLWMVANRHLPYESALSQSFKQVQVIAQAQGFKIIAARRASA